MSIADFLRSVPTHASYWWMLGFFAFYPVLSAITWVTMVRSFAGYRRYSTPRTRPECR